MATQVRPAGPTAACLGADQAWMWGAGGNGGAGKNEEGKFGVKSLKVELQGTGDERTRASLRMEEFC